MEDVMVTGRMAADKKAAGVRVLKREGMNASQAVNLMFDRIIDEGSAAFLDGGAAVRDDNSRWLSAAQFVDSLSCRRVSRFDDMSKAEIKSDRLRSKGLM